jgi:hypothetical protein
VRTAAATWTAIVDVVAPEGAPGRGQLESLIGIAASLIATEAWKKTPVIIAGVGPQLRVYCLHDEDAIVGDDANEDALAWSPTAGEWTIELPCPPEDLEWVQTALSGADAPVSAVDCTKALAAPAKEAIVGGAKAIDTEAFLRG